MTEGGSYVPGGTDWGNVPHYYGDVVRQCFVVGAALILLFSPFYTDTLRTHLPFLLFGGLVFVALAALTNPHNRSIVLADAVAAGVAVVIYQAWALFEYESSTWVEFALRELIALIFIAAFYFSMKTLRAMLLHKVGKREEVGEFDSEA